MMIYERKREIVLQGAISLTFRRERPAETFSDIHKVFLQPSRTGSGIQKTAEDTKDGPFPEQKRESRQTESRHFYKR